MILSVISAGEWLNVAFPLAFVIGAVLRPRRLWPLWLGSILLMWAVYGYATYVAHLMPAPGEPGAGETVWSFAIESALFMAGLVLFPAWLGRRARATGVFRLLVLLLIAVLTVSCTATTALTMADSGRSVSLRVNDEVTVSLDGNPTTGFDWAVVTTIAPVLEQIERTFTPQSSALGAGGTVHYRFRAAAAGTITLTLSYARSFESKPPERVFTVTVIAR